VSARTVVVTGGASGIGAATATRFREHGDRVVVVDRVAAADVTCDLADPVSIRRAVEQLPGRVDVLCNVAGVSGSSPAGLVLAVNFFGLRELTEQLKPRLVAGGAVVSVASTAAWYWRDHLDQIRAVIDAPDLGSWRGAHGEDIDGPSAYVLAKEAVVVWTILAAQRWQGQVRVNTVSPGAVDTPLLPAFYDSMGAEELTPLKEIAGGRDARPDEIAAAITYLAGPDASWINATDLVVDNGAEAILGLHSLSNRRVTTR
jgi:NAD(P)-dependent dehydrogenase (short-subunit alcohol dehydrogenase family)